MIMHLCQLKLRMWELSTLNTMQFALLFDYHTSEIQSINGVSECLLDDLWSFEVTAHTLYNSDSQVYLCNTNNIFSTPCTKNR